MILREIIAPIWVMLVGIFAVWCVYRGIHESNFFRLSAGGFILFLYVAMGLVWILTRNRQPPNPKQP